MHMHVITTPPLTAPHQLRSDPNLTPRRGRFSEDKDSAAQAVRALRKELDLEVRNGTVG